MICSIHQPNFLPWMGYFHKIFHSDVFVILDTVQYSKNSFINRNKIKTSNGAAWLTVPVLTKGKFGQTILETEINHTDPWSAKMQKTLLMNYKRAEHFEAIFPRILEVLDSGCKTISDLNVALIKWILKELDYHGKILRSSELMVKGDSTELLISICQAAGADTYLSGTGGSKYQEEGRFSENGIKLIYNDFQQPVYKQLWGEFVPGLSVFDFLMNCGFDKSVFPN